MDKVIAQCVSGRPDHRFTIEQPTHQSNCTVPGCGLPVTLIRTSEKNPVPMALPVGAVSSNAPTVGPIQTVLQIADLVGIVAALIDAHGRTAVLSALNVPASPDAVPDEIELPVGSA